MSVAIRRFRSEDADVCRALWRDLNRHHRVLYDDPTLGGEDPGLELDAYLADSRLHALFVAERAAAIVGLCGLLVVGDEAELEPIIVDPAHRRGGVGSALARRVVAEAAGLGVRYVNVRPVARNLGAIHFFHREGFTLLGRFELSIPLEGASPTDPDRRIDLKGLSFLE